MPIARRGLIPLPLIPSEAVFTLSGFRHDRNRPTCHEEPLYAYINVGY